MSITVMGIICLSGGLWIMQDAIASILYYLKRDNEKWYFNHAVRILRALWGITLIVVGIMAICYEWVEV